MITLPPLPFTARQALAYAVLPRIIPRLQALNIRFPFVAYLMGQLFGGIGLLPALHPYLNAHNIGTFSVRQVFIAAYGNLTWRWSHADQVIMFGVLLLAFLLLVIQFVMMVGVLLIGFAYANSNAAPTFTSIFITPNPTNDIAMMMLDRVFGVPGFFKSCISTAQPCESTSGYLTPDKPMSFPSPFQIGLQSLFGFYSMGVLMVGGMIVLYFIGVVILESVKTGIPFGKRFANVYAPIRLCLAILMLVPLPTPGVTGSGAGYNGAQYLTLWLAGLGSSVGTNTWHIFNNSLANPNQPGGAAGPTMTSPPQSTGTPRGSALIAKPEAPVIDPLIQFMLIARSCTAMYEAHPTSVFYIYDGQGKKLLNTMGQPIRQNVAPYLIASDGKGTVLQIATTYKEALENSKNRDIRLRVGVQKADQTIENVCGELSLPVANFRGRGAQVMTEAYFNMMAQMWENQMVKAFGDRMPYLHLSSLSATPKDICQVTVPYPEQWGVGSTSECGANTVGRIMPGVDYYNTIRDTFLDGMIANAIKEAREVQIKDATAPVENRILNRGWAGAGIWYNKLAEMNGGLFDATRGVPQIVYMPDVMEKIAKQRRAVNETVMPKIQYTPIDDGVITGYTLEIAKALNEIYVYFQQDEFAGANLTARSGNIIFDLMNTFFGTKPLFDMRSEVDVNPLIQIIALGKSVLDAAFFNIMAGGLIEVAGGVLQNLDGWNKFGAGLNTMGDAWFTVSMIGLGVGIIFYYVVPFLPFIYFFFSVVKWLQSIFEAMIGVPMWALAHLRIDGNGIPGEAASNGYYLLLEILLRPVLTILGMVASLIIFTATVFALNDIFDLVAVNLTGYTPPSPGSTNNGLAFMRGTVDQFFYTVMYVILVYIIATMSFKLIDSIPAKILRWIGSSAKNVVDEAGDPVPGMIRSIYIGNFGMPLIGQSGMIGQAVQGMRKAAEGTGQTIGQSLKGILKPSNKGVKHDDE